MLIKGQAELTFIHEDGTRDAPIITPFNDICWAQLRTMMLANGDWNVPTARDATSVLYGDNDHWYIFYGSKKIKKTFLNSKYAQEGYVAVIQNSPSYTAGATINDPDIITFSAVIPAPLTGTRTINALGLYYTSVGQVSGNVYTPSAKTTILPLTSTCTQTETSQISVVYRLFLYPVQASSSHRVSNVYYSALKDLLKRMCQAISSTRLAYSGVSNQLRSSSYNLDNLDPCSFKAWSQSTDQRNELTDAGFSRESGMGHVIYQNIRGITYNIPVSSTPEMGTFIKSLIIGGGYGPNTSYTELAKALTYQSPFGYSEVSPVQNIYPQRGSPVGPFQDISVATVATQKGSVSLDPSTWVDPKLQKLIRIKITNTGDLTSATYQLEVNQFIAGFAGNRWMPRTAHLPQALVNSSYFRNTKASEAIYESYPNFGGVTYRSPDDYEWVAAGDCQRTQGGITLYNILTGEKRNFNALSTPSMPITAAADIEVSNGYIYVACANTGLWRISPNLLTVEQVTSPTGNNQCYQLVVKNDANKTIWAMFNGGLCRLTNPAAALGSLAWDIFNPTTGSPNTFTYTGLTNANWDKCTSLVIDPDHAQDRFLIQCSVLPSGDTSNNNRKGYVWYTPTTGVAANPTTDGIPLSWPTWNQTDLLKISDCARCIDGVFLLSSSQTVNPTTSTNRLTIATYGQNNLNTPAILANCLSARAVPATINGIKGFLISDTSTVSSYTSVFMRTSNLLTAVNGSNVNAANPVTEFFLREGNGTYNNNLETTSINAGMISRPLLYMPNSNMFFSYEYQINGYGVTPFMLPPTNPKYNTYKAAFWKSYGWDGTAWVLNNAGSKPVHASTDVTGILDNLGISFAEGAAGTQFVNGEFWSVVVGDGLMKDNGTDYTMSMFFSAEPTQRILMTDNVPQTPLGALVDEPVSFSPLVRDVSFNTAEASFLQNKGVFVAGGVYNQMSISDQLIPASTPFDFRFKWISFESTSNIKVMGVATGTGTYTYSVNIRINSTSGALEVMNNTTLLATISNPEHDKECRIVRDASNVITVYYNGVQQGSTVTNASQFVIQASSHNNADESGWWDMKLTYTENRRVLKIGDSGTSTGYYNSKFSGLSTSSAAKDVSVLIGSPSPLTAILDYSSAGTPLAGTGRVKVATGAGWLIFHNSEPANPVNIAAVAHYVLNML